MAINGTLADISLQTLSASAASLADNASKNGIFVYDTSQDSDGGAWRHRTQNTSWYNETLNTSVRGSRREFPSVAIIVADNQDSGDVKIYDGDDPDLPLWMEFTLPGYVPGANWNQSIVGIGYVNVGDDFIPGALCMKNGLLAIGNVSPTASFQGAFLINFISDEMTTGASYGNAPNQFYRSQGKIVDRNNSTLVSHLARYGNSEYRSDIEGRMASNRVKDTAMTVLPGAAIEEKTGLPYVTVAFATEGGVTVIRDDYEMTGYNTVQQRYAVKISTGGSAYDYTESITFTDEGYLWWLGDSYNSYTSFRDSYALHTRQLVKMGQTDVQWDPSSDNLSGTGAHDFYAVSTGNELGEIRFGSGNSFSFNFIERNALGSGSGFCLHRPSVWNSPNRKGFAYIATSSWVSGWMSGNECKLAALANSATVDRSITNHNLSLTGSLTTAPVGTNSDITAYGGFSASNLLKHNNTVNYGSPAVFTIMAWIKLDGTSSYSYVATIYDSVNSRWAGLAINADGSGIPGVPYAYDIVNGQLAAPSDVRVNDGQWHHLCITYVHEGGAGRRDIYVDGKYVAGGSFTSFTLANVNYTAVGHYYQGSTTNYHFDGSLALVRIFNERTNPRDVKWIYESERELFRPESRGTLYGAADAVTALAYDQARGEYHVGTSAGRSVFKGLNRINNTTTAVTTAISAADGIVAEQ